MNQIHDTIDFSDISQACAQKENNYFCEMNSVTIHGATKISCSMQLILNSILRTGNFSQCLLEKLYYEHGQQYLVRNQRIYLTNPEKTDSLTLISNFCSKQFYTMMPKLNIFLKIRNGSQIVKPIFFNLIIT